MNIEDTALRMESRSQAKPKLKNGMIIWERNNDEKEMIMGNDTIANTGECGGIAYCGKSKWYHWPRFPLLPIFDYRKGDEWNTPDISFSWLNMRLWSIMSPDISVAITLEDTGCYIKIRIPYLIFVFYLMWFPISWNQRLWRKPKKDII